jgi:hypothetical protein
MKNVISSSDETGDDMNIVVFWRPIQWVLDKLWDMCMRLLPKPKSAVETLAALQLREREIEEHMPIYVQQLGFAFAALARAHPDANGMSLGALASAIDTTPEATAEIVRVLIKHQYLQPFRSSGPMGETQYVLTHTVVRPRVYRL